jgi:biotin carboxyl carrier protein
MKKLLITVNGKRYEVDVEVVQDDDAIEVQQAVRPIQPTATQVIPVKPAGKAPKPKVKAGDSKTLTSPINGVVLEIPIQEGQEVRESDILFVLEAMKMKTNISAPHAGKIKSIHVKLSESIEAGRALLTFE